MTAPRVSATPGPEPIHPPLVGAARAAGEVRARGFAVLDGAAVRELAGIDAHALAMLARAWDDLPPDAYLRDGGRYRRRRHACYVVDATVGADARADAAAAIAPPVAVPHRAHWQPLEYNALHGGMARWFEPVRSDVVALPAWTALLRAVAGQAASQRPGVPRWFVEAHQFRIDTGDGIGRPTPEGAHRDGVDLVAVFVVARDGIVGGETRVFEAEGPGGQRFTLPAGWSLLLLDDARVIHESTPIRPLVDGCPGHRDTLVVTCRAGGFQGGDAPG